MAVQVTFTADDFAGLREQALEFFRPAAGPQEPSARPPVTSQKTAPSASTEPSTAPASASSPACAPAVDAPTLRAQIRQVLAPLMKDADKGPRVNALIKEHGAESLSKVADDQLESLLAKAKELQ